MLEVGAGRDERTTFVGGPVHPGHQHVAPGRLALLVGQWAQPFNGERPPGQDGVDDPVGGLGVALEPGEIRGGDRVQAQLLPEAGGLGGSVGLDPRFLKSEHVRGGPLDPRPQRGVPAGPFAHPALHVPRHDPHRPIFDQDPLWGPHEDAAVTTGLLPRGSRRRRDLR